MQIVGPLRHITGKTTGCLNSVLLPPLPGILSFHQYVPGLLPKRKEDQITSELRTERFGLPSPECARHIFGQ